jgi:hypothetical protein
VNLADAVRRLAGDSLHRGAGQLSVHMWDRVDVLVCELADTTVIEDLLVGRRLTQSPGRDWVCLANQVCDLVQVRSGDSGTIIRTHMRK